MMNYAAPAATAFFPRGFLAGRAFFSFCEASRAEVRETAAYASRRVLVRVVYEDERSEGKRGKVLSSKSQKRSHCTTSDSDMTRCPSWSLIDSFPGLV